MAEANNTNVALEAIAVATAIRKFSATDRAAYAAAATRSADAAARDNDPRNGDFWRWLAAMITANSPGALAAAEDALKRHGLSVSASTAAALRAWKPGMDAKAATAAKKLPGWVWLAAAGLGFVAWKAR